MTTTTTCPDAPAGGTTCDIGTCARCDAAAGITPDPFDTGRDLDWSTLKAQMGLMNLLAISGGRAYRVGPSTIDLPVSSGYRVRITLAANDTYTVTRLMKRGGKEFIKGTMTDVYCDQVGNIAYAASSYKSYGFGS